jgi:hypothetical protein
LSQAIKRCGAEHLVGRERFTPFRKIKSASQDGRQVLLRLGPGASANRFCKRYSHGMPG